MGKPILPICRSPRPLLKRKRASNFESPKASSEAVVVPDSTRSTTSVAETELDTEDSHIPVIHINDVDPVEFRRSMLRELGVGDDFPVERAMEIPEDYFWNDQHPQECPCVWCEELFGHDLLARFERSNQ